MFSVKSQRHIVLFHGTFPVIDGDRLVSRPLKSNILLIINKLVMLKLLYFCKFLYLYIQKACIFL